jgi:hypothetical protein
VEVVVAELLLGRLPKDVSCENIGQHQSHALPLCNAAAEHASRLGTRIAYDISTRAQIGQPSGRQSRNKGHKRVGRKERSVGAATRLAAATSLGVWKAGKLEIMEPQVTHGGLGEAAPVLSAWSVHPLFLAR